MEYMEMLQLLEDGKFGVITGLSFQKCTTGSDVGVWFTFWDDVTDRLHNSGTVYRSIYTHRKPLFQSFCNDFLLYKNGRPDFASAIGSLCVVDWHGIYGPMLYAVKENDDYDTELEEAAISRLQDVPLQGIGDIPYDLLTYWFCPGIDSENIRSKKYHGLIVGVGQRPISENDCKTIIRVAVLLDGKPVVIPHYINTLHDNELENLVRMYGDGEYLESILYRQVDVKLFQTSSDKIYVGSILRPSYHAAAEEQQVKLLLNDYKRFVMDPANAALDYNER